MKRDASRLLVELDVYAQPHQPRARKLVRLRVDPDDIGLIVEGDRGTEVFIKCANRTALAKQSLDEVILRIDNAYAALSRREES